MEKESMYDSLQKSLAHEIARNKELIDEIEKLQRKNNLLKELLEEKDEIIDKLLNRIRQDEIIKEMSKPIYKKEKNIPS